MKKTTEKFTFIDLFAGIGGFRIALESLGGECVYTSEFDKFCAQVLEHNFGEKPAGDITQVDAKDIPDFDVLTAGFPCQPFSFAGGKKGFQDETRGTLFFDVVRIIKEKRPKMFLLENVKGLKGHDNGKTLEIILKTLKELDYDIHWKVLNSYDFGVPQLRERWYCVGYDRKVNNFSFPVGNKSGTKLIDIIDLSNKDPKLKLSEFEIKRIEHHFNNPDTRVEHDNSIYGPETKKGKHGVWSYLKPDGALRFHINDFAKTQIQEAYYVSLAGVAPTIIANRAPKLWDLKRHLSVDENRKLQGFPDDFKFNVSDNQARKQLGNAVCVPVVKAVAESMLIAYNQEKHFERSFQPEAANMVLTSSANLV